MESLINFDLGRYHIVEKLGEGGMASVYKAYDPRLDRMVAVKVIPLFQRQSEQFSRRFEREAKALAKLTHPNIVPVIDYGEQDGMLYLVMTYVPGGTLRERMGSPLSWQQSARFLAPVAGALDYAHRNGIIHRDVKPANILIMSSGQPMLSDFGIAKLMQGQTTQLTGTGMGIGTPDYMAPEQGHGMAVDARSDVYSLGVVYYEMVTGRKPFQADTPLAVLIKHMTEPLPRPSDFAPGLPEAAEQVIFKALAKNPTERFQDMAAFQTALENLAYATSAAAPGGQPLFAIETPPAAVQTAPVPAAAQPIPVQTQPPAQPIPVQTQPAAQPLPVQAQTAAREVSPAPFPLADATTSTPVAAPPRPAPVAARKKIPAWLFWAGGAALIGFLALAVVGVIYLAARQPGGSPAQAAASLTDTPSAEETASSSVTLSPQAPADFLSADPTRLVVYHDNPIDSLDPSKSPASGNLFTVNIYETLVTLRTAETNQWIPMLADSWEISPDGTTYVFHIRSGVTFHEGGTLTAGDVAYTLQRLILAGPDYGFTLASAVLGVDDITTLIDDTGTLYAAPDQLWQQNSSALIQACQTVQNAIVADETAGIVTIRLAEPDFTILSVLANPALSIFDKEWSMQQGSWDGECYSWQFFYYVSPQDSPFFEKANGTAPFRLEQWDREAGVLSLARSENYWRQQPAWDGAPVGPAALQRVELHYLEDPEKIQSILQNEDVDIVLKQQASYWTGGWNLEAQSSQDCVFNLLTAGFSCSPLAGEPFTQYRLLPSAAFSSLAYNFDIQPAEGQSLIGSGRMDGSGISPDFFNDRNVRLGFNACLDTQTVIEQMMYGDGYHAGGLSTFGMEGFNYLPSDPAFNLEECAYRLRSTSYQNLWETGFRFQVPINASRSWMRPVFENLAQNLKTVNNLFTIEIIEVENAQYIEYRSNHNLPLVLAGWSADYFDANDMYVYYDWVHNFTSLPDSYIDTIQQLRAQAKQENDAGVRAQIYRSLALYVEENALTRLIAMQAHRYYLQPWVDGFEYNPSLEAPYFYLMSEH